MPVIKISLTKDQDEELRNLANEKEMSIQDFIRYTLFSKKNPSIFVPEEAVKRALKKFSKEDPPFSLPDVYGDEWSKLDPRMTGVFGKRFFNYLKNFDSIDFAGMTPDGRRATYRVV